MGNGGCSQLCFSYPSNGSYSSSLIYNCDCATGSVSPDDKRKCTTYDEYLVFSTRTEIRAVDLDPKSTVVPFKPLVSEQ